MPELTKLILCDSQPINLDAASKTLPSRLKIMNWGVNDGAKGKFIINAAGAQQFAANQKASNFDRVAFDFEHNTVKGSTAYKGEPCEVAGHGTPEIVDGEGLFLNNIEWTAEGQKFVGGRHYIDASPSVITNGAGEVIFLHSVAACRQGALVGSELKLNSADFPNLKLNNSTMNYKDIILKLLKLPATATDEEITAALDAAMKTEVETLSADSKCELLKQIKTLTATVDTLVAGQKTLETKVTTDERTLILNSAAAEGKVVPKELTEGDSALDIKQLKTLVAALPVTVPLERRTPAQTPHSAPGALTTLSAEEAVRKQLGITEEEWKKIA